MINIVVTNMQAEKAKNDADKAFRSISDTAKREVILAVCGGGGGEFFLEINCTNKKKLVSHMSVQCSSNGLCSLYILYI